MGVAGKKLLKCTYRSMWAVASTVIFQLSLVLLIIVVIVIIIVIIIIIIIIIIITITMKFIIISFNDMI